MDTTTLECIECAGRFNMDSLRQGISWETLYEMALALEASRPHNAGASGLDEEGFFCI